MNSILKKRGARTTTTVCLAILLSLLGVHSALAHAQLVKSAPTDKVKLQVAPEKVELWFNELLDDGFNTIEVYSATELNARKHTNLVKGVPQVDAKERTHLSIPLETLKPGDYVIDYRVLSRDGHTAPGRVRFHVLEAK
jgi:methionine-rich copper-binding protein CopC